MQIEPDWGKARARMGEALAALGKHEEAARAYGLALKLEPGSASYLQSLRGAEAELAKARVAAKENARAQEAAAARDKKSTRAAGVATAASAAAAKLEATSTWSTKHDSHVSAFRNETANTADTAKISRPPPSPQSTVSRTSAGATRANSTLIAPAAEDGPSAPRAVLPRTLSAPCEKQYDSPPLPVLPPPPAHEQTRRHDHRSPAPVKPPSPSQAVREVKAAAGCLGAAVEEALLSAEAANRSADLASVRRDDLLREIAELEQRKGVLARTVATLHREALTRRQAQTEYEMAAMSRSRNLQQLQKGETKEGEEEKKEKDAKMKTDDKLDVVNDDADNVDGSNGFALPASEHSGDDDGSDGSGDDDTRNGDDDDRHKLPEDGTDVGEGTDGGDDGGLHLQDRANAIIEEDDDNEEVETTTRDADVKADNALPHSASSEDTNNAAVEDNILENSSSTDVSASSDANDGGNTTAVHARCDAITEEERKTAEMLAFFAVRRLIVLSHNRSNARCLEPVRSP